jgi:minor extracellular serine protease Vpr
LAGNRSVNDTDTTLALSSTSLTLAAGATQNVTLTFSGTAPPAGFYYGDVTITGGAVSVNVPFQYVVSSGTPNDLFTVAGDGDVGFINQTNSEGLGLLKVIDQYGVGLPNLPVTWSASGGGSISNADSTTDSEGFAGAVFTLGPTGNGQPYSFTANVGTFTSYTFTDYAYNVPTISSGGVGNAASFQLGQGIAPGSLVAVFGTGFAGDAVTASYLPLPISIYSPSYELPVSVGFDASGVSVPAPLLYVSGSQINLQVPWELAGQSTATMKVNLEPLNGAVFTVPIATYSPACYTINSVVAALNYPSYSLVTSANPAVPGQYVILYCNGLGPVNNTPADGVAASDATSTTTTTPTVTIGGQNAAVSFSGLAPGFAGLYQINVQVPSGAIAGTQPLVVSIGGISSPTLNLPVQ